MTTAKSRIFAVAPGAGQVHRGIERQFVQLSRHLSARFDMTLLCRGVVPVPHRRCTAMSRFSGPARFVDSLPGVGRLFRRLHLSGTDLEMLTFCLRALPTVLREKPELLLIGCGYWGCVLGRIARRRCGIPFVTAGGRGLQGEYEDGLSRPDGHIVFNPFFTDGLRERLPGHRIEAIPGGVDLAAFRPEGDKARMSLRRPIFLAVGALEPDKRLDLAVRSVSRVGEGSLAVFGQGREQDALRVLGASELGQERFLLRSADPLEMPSFYRACDAFTLPSRAEPFGLVYLEAMACNKPVVAQKDEVREWLIGDAGLCVDCQNIDAYAAALKKAVTASWGDRPRARAETFGWQTVADRYAAVFQDVLSRTGCR